MLAIVAMCIPFGYLLADTVTITHFAVKENPFANNEVAIIAVDTANNILENVNGTYAFTVNGFEEALTFDKGTAFYRHKLDKSSFLYVKHVNASGTHSILFYVYKHDSKLNPIHISWILLILVPVILFLLAWAFRKFVIIAIIIFCVFLYFNYHNGLSIPTFFESIVDGIKNLFK